MIFVGFSFILLAISIFYYYGKGLPDYNQLKEYEPPIVTRLYANDGQVFAEYAFETRLFVPIESIPKLIRQAFLSAEDKDFYKHSGINFYSVLRAMTMNLMRLARKQRPIGASTITQQVARNFLLSEISRQVSFVRKIKEAILALRIENTYTKDHIFELYLNEIYLGQRSYGVAAAALNYFNKSLDELTIGEAAFLACLPKAPNHYHPQKSLRKALMRRNWVIGRMFDNGFISEKEAIKATSEPLAMVQRDVSKIIKADYFTEKVRRELLSRYGEYGLYKSGLTVRTTLDSKLQNIATKSLRKGLINYDRRHGWRGPFFNFKLENYSKEECIRKLKAYESPIEEWSFALVVNCDDNFVNIILSDGKEGKILLSELKWARKYISSDEKGPIIKHVTDVLKKGDVILVELIDNGKVVNNYRLCQIPEVSGGIIVMDAHFGKVLALSGGFSFKLSEYDKATQAKRQPGSAFKPFIYLSALENGLTPVTIIEDSPIAIDLGQNLGVWKPQNYTRKFFGPTTLRNALEKSRNIVTVRLVNEILGVEKIAEIGRRFGIYDNSPMHLSIALGAGETTLLKLITAYAMLVNGGYKIEPRFVDRIQDRRGKTVYFSKGRVCEACYEQDWQDGLIPPVLYDSRTLITDPVYAYQIVSFLEGAVKRGTARRLKTLNRVVAGKTGTTNNFFDAWFFGCMQDIIIGVYIGFDDPKTLGEHENGSRVAAPVVNDFIAEALSDYPDVPFKVPSGINFVRINLDTGKVAKSNNSSKVILEAFKSGTENLKNNIIHERISGVGGLY